MENYRNMTVNELIKDGAKVEVYYYGTNRNRVEAMEKIDAFDLVPELVRHGTGEWVRGKSGDDLEVVAFYEEDDRGGLTDEQKMREAGHKYSDFY